MVRHCVLLSFHGGTPETSIRSVEERFVSLKTGVAEVMELEWGLNSSPEGLDKGFTHCFFLSFADDAARDRYLVHPLHQAFGALVGPLLADVLVVDYRL